MTTPYHELGDVEARAALFGRLTTIPHVARFASIEPISIKYSRTNCLIYRHPELVARGVDIIVSFERQKYSRTRDYIRIHMTSHFPHDTDMTRQMDLEELSKPKADVTDLDATANRIVNHLNTARRRILKGGWDFQIDQYTPIPNMQDYAIGIGQAAEEAFNMSFASRLEISPNQASYGKIQDWFRVEVHRNSDIQLILRTVGATTEDVMQTTSYLVEKGYDITDISFAKDMRSSITVHMSTDAYQPDYFTDIQECRMFQRIVLTKIKGE